jgi:hypothetical protein
MPSNLYLLLTSLTSLSACQACEPGEFWNSDSPSPLQHLVNESSHMCPIEIPQDQGWHLPSPSHCYHLILGFYLLWSSSCSLQSSFPVTPMYSFVWLHLFLVCFSSVLSRGVWGETQLLITSNTVANLNKPIIPVKTGCLFANREPVSFFFFLWWYWGLSSGAHAC